MLPIVFFLFSRVSYQHKKFFFPKEMFRYILLQFLAKIEIEIIKTETKTTEEIISVQLFLGLIFFIFFSK